MRDCLCVCVRVCVFVRDFFERKHVCACIWCLCLYAFACVLGRICMHVHVIVDASYECVLCECFM